MKKQKMLDYINYQLKMNIKEEEGILAKNKDLLYIKLNNQIRNLLIKNKIEYNEHLNSKGWVYIK